MSDINSRPVGGPPKRAAKAPASSLIKRNRPQPSFPSLAESIVVTSEQALSASDVSPVELPAGESIAPEALLDRPDAAITASAVVASAEPLEPAAEVRAAAPATSDKPTSGEARATSVAPTPVQKDTLVNTTFRVRRSAKKAFDAAFIAAKLHEGWPSAEAFFQDLLERETERIQNNYNDGQPFPIRERALPRGRPIGS